VSGIERKRKEKNFECLQSYQRLQKLKTYYMNVWKKFRDISQDVLPLKDMLNESLNDRQKKNYKRRTMGKTQKRIGIYILIYVCYHKSFEIVA
jgi:hypothetical protein